MTHSDSNAAFETLPSSDGPAQGNCAEALPELLAPAGDWECARAAVENGADAIYFGLERFNARLRAQNFTGSDLPKLMDYLHGRGVKAYVTLNTLVFQNELGDAAEVLRTIIAAGVDAVIVQDIGICRLIRQLSPDFPIHASTQMTVTSATGISFAKELGCNLVVLARECSLKEIHAIQEAQRTNLSAQVQSIDTKRSGQIDANLAPLPLEVFVHGALCVAYSGQCLTSEALGGRSANRGECAQACRMPYDLIADGKQVSLGDRRYLLSPQDLAGLPLLPQLIAAGVASLKIEGRLKSPEYVANITRVYRKAIDALAVPLNPKTSGAQQDSKPLSEFGKLLNDSRYHLEMAFSRGLHTGWFEGINNQKLVHARFGKKRGVYLGRVARVLQREVQVRLVAPLKPGDGIVFDAGKPAEEEEGGRVYELREAGPDTLLSFGHGRIDFQRIQIGDRLWKTNDPDLDRELRRTFVGEKPHFTRPLHFGVRGKVGESLTIIARDEEGHVIEAQSAMALTRAESHPLTAKQLETQLGRLGGTPFKFASLQVDLGPDVILPVSELNRLRRELVARLQKARGQHKTWTLNATPPENVQMTSPRPTLESTATLPQSPAELLVLVRNLEQLDAAIQSGIQTIYCELEDPKKYREAVARFRTRRFESENHAKSAIYVAPPRIYKTGEEWILKQVRSCDADGYLIRNYDHLRYFAGCRCIGDYSLNVANALSAEYFKTRFDLARITASYDLNQMQLEALLQAAPPEWFEITIHQHMPMFHMEHCVFCAFLSSGTDFTNCGRPCDTRKVELQDRVGARHPVKADAGCRNTVFNALAQTGAEFATKLAHLGARFFRIEFLDEAPELVTQTIKQYQKLFSGQLTGTQLWRDLRLMNQLGVTRGQLDNRRSTLTS